MKALIVIALVWIPAAASAAGANYGSPAACTMVARDGDPWFMPDAESVVPPIFLMGDVLLGIEERCDLSTVRDGQIACEGDGEWMAEFAMKKTADAAVITIDGETYVLPRCR